MQAVRFLLVLLCLSAPASAQVPPSPIPSAAVQPNVPLAPPPDLERVQVDLERQDAQLRESQLVLRRTVLGMLSPAQRELVATTIGQLAVASDPNVATAMQRIDAALSPAQRDAIPRLVAAEASRRQAMFMAMVAQSRRDMAAQELPATMAQQMTPLAGQGVPPPAGKLPAAGMQRSSGIMMFHASSGVVMSGSPLLGVAPGQSAGMALLMLLTSPSASPFRMPGVIIRTPPASSSTDP